VKSIRVLYSDAGFVLMYTEPILVSTQRHVADTGLEGDRFCFNRSLYTNPMSTGWAWTSIILEDYKDVYMLDACRQCWWNKRARF
jgi:hypothetical protein